MSRITGNEVKNLMEAYASVYAPQELTEEQIWEEVEFWVNTLVEEGYDLSEHTWEEMYDLYIQEAIGQPGSAGYVNWMDKGTGQVRSGYKSSSDGKLYRNYNDALAARNSRLRMQQDFRNQVLRAAGGGTIRQPAPAPRASGGGGGGGVPSRPAAPVTRAPAPAAPRPAATPAAPVQKGPTGMPLVGGIERRIPTRAEMDAAAARRTAAAAPASSTGQAPGAPAKPFVPAAAPASSTGQALGAPVKPFVPAAAPAAAPIAGKNELTQANIARKVAPGAPARPSTMRTPTRAPILQMQDFDVFDVIRGYLLDEGYADTEEAALAIMTSMSEEWKQSIMEGPAGMMMTAASKGLGSLQQRPGIQSAGGTAAPKGPVGGGMAKKPGIQSAGGRAVG